MPPSRFLRRTAPFTFAISVGAISPLSKAWCGRGQWTSTRVASLALACTAVQWMGRGPVAGSNRTMCGHTAPKYSSSDHDRLFEFHRCQATSAFSTSTKSRPCPARRARIPLSNGAS
jgi:hypothetical protein